MTGLACGQDGIKKNHMDILWHEYGARDGNVPIREAGLQARASIVGRLGMMMLACGTGAWRVRTSMNTLSELMHMTCSADVGLMSIQYSCFDGRDSFTQSLSLTNTGVNTSQLTRLEKFVRDFREHELSKTCDEIHSDLDEIEKLGGLYSHLSLGFASAFACGAFTFLLGGGLVEMFCAFWGAGIGHFIRCKLIKRHLTLFLNVMVSVSAACVSYTILFRLLEMFLHVRFQHEAGYICSMLFIIPGFPFITCGIDLAKLDMRSGLERLMYALIIITVATMTAWILAVLLRLHPTAFLPQNLFLWQQILFRLVASFCGVFGFSMMFNSPLRLAAAAGLIGAFSNTLRLELVDLCSMAPAAAAFLGAFCSGLAASAIKGLSGFPRIALTVPSIVIMVPGLYLYKSFYNLGVMNLTGAMQWLCMATLIVLALPLGLVAARILTDRNFRHCT